jgi:hypothetical protein
MLGIEIALTSLRHYGRRDFVPNHVGRHLRAPSVSFRQIGKGFLVSFGELLNLARAENRGRGIWLTVHAYLQ